MANPATLPAPVNSPNTQAATTAGPANAAGSAQPALIPFTRGSYEHVEPIVDVSVVMDANTHIIGPFDVPSYGYLRSLLIMVNATGGAGGAAVVAAFEDSPWASINTITFYDVDGAPLMSVSGHDLYLIHKYQNFMSDPINAPFFSAVVTGNVAGKGNFAFMLRLPIEISDRDALGSLPNQDSATTYKCMITMANAAGVYTVSPETLPTVRWRVFAEEWAQPNPTDLMGRPQAQEPPDVGTTQFWRKVVKVVGAGSQTVRVDQVGNLIRNIIFVFRNNTPVRDTIDFPDPIQLVWDGRIMTNEARDIRRFYMWEHYDYAPSAIDTGVFTFDFIHDLLGRNAGGELRDLWIPTTTGTLLTLVGTFGVAGNLTMLVNEVQPKGSIYNAIA